MFGWNGESEVPPWRDEKLGVKILSENNFLQILKD
jgi:hypothetical protein